MSLTSPLREIPTLLRKWAVIFADNDDLSARSIPTFDNSSKN